MPRTLIIFLFLGMIGCAAAVSVPVKSELIGSWTVEYIGERPVIDNSPAYIKFLEEDRVAGNSSCNQFTGTYNLRAGDLEVSKLASTKKMCPPALMEQEKRFLATLQRVKKFHIVQGLLVLLDENNETLFKASPRPK